MTDRDIEQAILADLADAGGSREGAPKIAGVASEIVISAIGRLQRSGSVSVFGPPNQNSDLGMDVCGLTLLPRGRMLANGSRW